jgi:hypothetical protein
MSNDCLAFHEPSPRLFGLSKLCYFKTPSEDFLDVFGEAFISAREIFLNLSSELGRNYVETSPQITFLAKAIHKMLPDAKFIHMVRDPYAVVRSMMRRKWYSGNSYDKFRISPKSNQPYYDKWSQMTNFEKNIWLWAETNQWIMDFTITLPEGKKLLIKAEELFMSKENALKRLFKFVDSPKPPKKKILQLLRKKLNAQVNGHFPEPARWTPEMHNQMNHIAGKIATKLGYNL